MSNEHNAHAMKLALDLISAGVAEIIEGWFCFDKQPNGGHIVSINTRLMRDWNEAIYVCGWDRAREALAARGWV